MAKRFSATELWDEDWFLDMPNEYKLFWFYMLSTCDHAGFFKVNLKIFCALNKIEISPSVAIKKFNSGKKRVRLIKDDFWFIEDFIYFQYGHKLNKNNNLHRSVFELLEKYKQDVGTVRGVTEVSERSKEGVRKG